MGKTKPINSEGKPIIEKAFWTEITIIQQWNDKNKKLYNGEFDPGSG